MTRKLRTDALNVEAGDGLTVDDVGGNRLLSVTDPNPGHIRDAFIGQIVEKGPAEQDDFTDARYWVRELIDTDMDPTRSAEPLRLELRDDWLNETVPARNQAVWPSQWTAATNLSELGPGPETHSLPPSTTVHLFRNVSLGSRTHFYFNSPVAGAERFAIVRDIHGGDTKFVTVQEVRGQADDPSIMESVGDPWPVAVWPGLRSRHYEGFVWVGSTIEPATSIISARRINGVWYAAQILRWKTQQMPPGLRVSDCGVLRSIQATATAGEAL